MKNEKEELKRKLKAIIDSEQKAIIDEHYPEFKAYEGRFFKTRNSFGNGKNWWLYTKVVSVTKDLVYTSGENALSNFNGYSFQIDTYGVLTIEQNLYSYIHSLDVEITENEFNNAWNKAMDSLAKLP